MWISKRTMHSVFLEVFLNHGNGFAHMAMNLGGLLACRLCGGGKRVEKPDEKDSVKTPKDIKQTLTENIVQLKAMTDPHASISNVINEIVKIVPDVKDNPTAPVLSLSKKATILVSTMAISTRPEQHIEFITEQVLGERLEKLDNILRMTVIAKKIPLSFHSICY